MIFVVPEQSGEVIESQRRFLSKPGGLEHTVNDSVDLLSLYSIIQQDKVNDALTIILARSEKKATTTKLPKYYIMFTLFQQDEFERS